MLRSSLQNLILDKLAGSFPCKITRDIEIRIPRDEVAIKTGLRWNDKLEDELLELTDQVLYFPIKQNNDELRNKYINVYLGSHVGEQSISVVVNCRFAMLYQAMWVQAQGKYF